MQSYFLTLAPGPSLVHTHSLLSLLKLWNQWH